MGIRIAVTQGPSGALTPATTEGRASASVRRDLAAASSFFRIANEDEFLTRMFDVEDEL